MQRAVPLRQLQARLSSELARAAGLLHAWSDRLADGDPNPTLGSERVGASGSLEARVAAARAQGAPEHWLDVVRAHAPDLLDGGGLRVTSDAPDHRQPRTGPRAQEPASAAGAGVPAVGHRAGPAPDPADGSRSSGVAAPVPGATSPASDPPAPAVAPTRGRSTGIRSGRTTSLAQRARRALADALAPDDRGPRPEPTADRVDAATTAGPIRVAPAGDAFTPAAAGLGARSSADVGARPAPRIETGRPGGPPATPAPSIAPPGPGDGRAATTVRHPAKDETVAPASATRVHAGVDGRDEHRGGDPATTDHDDTTGAAGTDARRGHRSTAPGPAEIVVAASPAPTGRAPSPEPGAAAGGDHRRVPDDRHRTDARPPLDVPPPMGPLGVHAAPDDPRDRWPDLPAGSADPRARDRGDRPAPGATRDDRWPALPDEDDRWLVDPGRHSGPPLAAVGGRAVGSDRDRAAELDAEQRGR